MRPNHPLIVGVGLTQLLAAMHPPGEKMPKWMCLVLDIAQRRDSRGWRKHVRQTKSTSKLRRF